MRRKQSSSSWATLTSPRAVSSAWPSASSRASVGELMVVADLTSKSRSAKARARSQLARRRKSRLRCGRARVKEAIVQRFPLKLFLFAFFGWVFDFYDLVLLGFLKDAVGKELGFTHASEGWILGTALGA